MPSVKSSNNFIGSIKIGNGFFCFGFIDYTLIYACKLLLEDKMNISGICYESGFNNVSNFNEQFKKIKGVSPSQYLKMRLKSA